MSPEQFAFWLNGFFEIQNPKTLDEKQTQQVKDHLALVFNKVTPERNILEDFRMPDNFEVPDNLTPGSPQRFCRPGSTGSIC